MTIDSLQPPIRGLIIDMDGVLWRGDHPIGDLPAVFAGIHARGLRVMLVTNNATRSAEDVRRKLVSFGVELKDEQIATSAQAVAYLLKRRFPQGGPVYIIGESGLRSALHEQGFHHAEEGVLAVVAGLDRELTYQKLRAATLLIRAGAPFFGSNPDLTYPAPEGLVPGAGAILAALEASSGVKPEIAGKPLPGLYQLALERIGVGCEQVLVVGDRLDTDILGGQRLSCRTAIVLSGVATLADVQAWDQQPDLVAPTLGHLLGLPDPLAVNT